MNRRKLLKGLALAPLVAFAGISSEMQWYPSNLAVSRAILEGPKRSWVRDEYLYKHVKDGWQLVYYHTGELIQMANVKNTYWLMSPPTGFGLANIGFA